MKNRSYILLSFCAFITNYTYVQAGTQWQERQNQCDKDKSTCAEEQLTGEDEIIGIHN